LGSEAGKSAQAICLMLQVPEEIYVLLRPEGGWGDLETLWHELGHGLSAVFTSPDLSTVTRNMGTSFALSEAFAFLMQNLVLFKPLFDRIPGAFSLRKCKDPLLP
jgi:oligoendopeptidase F